LHRALLQSDLAQSSPDVRCITLTVRLRIIEIKILRKRQDVKK
jgi:hypothetical protein